jgi:hypothetical protein
MEVGLQGSKEANVVVEPTWTAKALVLIALLPCVQS